MQFSKAIDSRSSWGSRGPRHPALGRRASHCRGHTPPDVVGLLALLSAVVVALTVCPGQVRAQHGHGHASGVNHGEYPNLVGARVGYLWASEPDTGTGRATYSFFLVGLSYERTVIHEFLEVEITAPVAVSPGHEVTMPIDLYLKLPFHPTPGWSPYVAAGPSLDVILRPSFRVLRGSSLALGTYLWASPRLGIDLELDGNFLFGAESPIYEVVFAAGLVFRFCVRESRCS